LDQTTDRPNIRAIVIANKEGGIKNDAEAVVPDEDAMPLDEGAKLPPVAAESWPNPMDGGEARNTVYTFFRKVSPTTQEGLSPPGGISLPMLKSKIAPMQRELVDDNGPRFISSGLMDHDLPPKAIEMETLVEHGNV
jgi:hypothetical protein